MFERFTERSRKVVVLAQEKARRLRYNYIGTEHLLLGLLREDEGVAAQVLRGSGVTVEGVREQIEGLVGYGEAHSGQAPFAQVAKKGLEASLREALQLGHGYIGTEHLLLGLTRLPKSTAVRALINLGVDPEAVRRETLGRLEGGARSRIEGELGPLGWAREALKRSFGRYPEAEDRASFERFTERARKVVVLARDEARHFDHNYIGTEHLLLGLVREEDGVASQALRHLGLDPDEAREQVEIIVGFGEGTGPQAPFTPRTNKIFQLALREALRLGHGYVGTEHILLGLVADGEGVAARVLTNLDVGLEAIRCEVLRRISGDESGAEPSEEDGRGTEGDEGSRARFRARVVGIRVEVPDPGGEGRGGSVPVVVDLEYGYDVVREGSDGFEAVDHGHVADLAGRFLEARGPSSLEGVVGLTGDLLLEEISPIQEVTVTATREGSGPVVSATFRR